MSATTIAPRCGKTVHASQPANQVAAASAAPPRKTSELRKCMQQDLQVAGLSERTQQAYLRAVRQLAAHFKTPPDQLTEVQLREYLLFLKNDKQFAAASLKIAFCGIKFFYTHTVPRDWQTLERIRVPRPKALPDVLTTDEVRRLIDAVRTPHNKAYFWTVYSLGLRLQEGLHLQVGDIDSQRLLVHVHRGKGAKDRYVPLPAKTLAVLRDYWATHRNPTWLFPATGRDHAQAATATPRQLQRFVRPSRHKPTYSSDLPTSAPAPTFLAIHSPQMFFPSRCFRYC